MTFLSRRSGDRDHAPSATGQARTGTVKDLSPRRISGLRKAEIVAALRSGVISNEEACDAYGLSTEEIAAWERALDSLKVRVPNPPDAKAPPK